MHSSRSFTVGPTFHGRPASDDGHGPRHSGERSTHDCPPVTSPGLLHLLVEVPQSFANADLLRLLREAGVTLLECHPPVLAPVPPTPAHLLTPRERELLAAITYCADENEVAARFYISRATVKTHLRNIFRKLGAASRAHAVGQAPRLGLLDLHDLFPPDQP